jgi:hypothetical protein
MHCKATGPGWSNNDLVGVVSIRDSNIIGIT